MCCRRSLARQVSHWSDAVCQLGGAPATNWPRWQPLCLHRPTVKCLITDSTAREAVAVDNSTITAAGCAADASDDTIGAPNAAATTGIEADRSTAGTTNVAADIATADSAGALQQ